MTTAVHKRAQEIHAEGLLAYREGKIPLFKGFPTTLNRRFITALRFKENTAWSITKAIVLPLDRLEYELDVAFFLAQRDFPLHSTLMEGLTEEESPYLPHFYSLKRNSELLSLRSTLRGLEINYSNLVLDKSGNILLLAEDIPDVIPASRKMLARLYREHRLAPLPIHDILHITVGRVMQFPNENPAHIAEFLEEFGTIAKSIMRSGLPLVVSSETTGENSYEFLT